MLFQLKIRLKSCVLLKFSINFTLIKAPPLKRTLTLFFLSLFCFSTLQPVIPYIDYVFNYDYIADVLCVNKKNVALQCNGKCHLKQQLSKTVTPFKSKNPKNISELKFDQRILILQKVDRPSLLHKRRGLKLTSFYFENLNQYGASQPPSPPPRFYILLS